MPSLGATQSANPIGCQVNNINTNWGIEVVANSSLNGLADGANVSGLIYNNIASATNARIIIEIQKVTPTGMNPNIQIDNGTNYYEITVNTTNSAKRVEFVDIPASFLANFKIFNNLGVAFPASGNTCTVYPV